MQDLGLLCVITVKSGQSITVLPVPIVNPTSLSLQTVNLVSHFRRSQLIHHGPWRSVIMQFLYQNSWLN